MIEQRSTLKKVLHVLNIIQLTIFMSLIVLGVVFLLNTRFFAKKYAEFLVIDTDVQQADAIAILSGNEGLYRLLEGITLYKDGYSDQLILSGYTGIDSVAYMFEKNEVSTEGVEVHEASSTYENAVQIKAYLDSKGFDSVLIVTSPAQSRRAMMVFEDVMPDVEIHLSYSELHTYDPEKIFESKDIRENFTNEGMKYLYYFLEYGLK